MANLVKHSSTSNLIRFVLKHSTTGVGLINLSSASSGLIISTICDNEATATTYTVAGSTIESIATLGTFAAPTATKCRFKEVDATNHKGLYEFQFADARFSVASAKRLIISVTGATNLLDADYEIQLVQFDPYNATTLGLTNLDAAISSRMATYTQPTGFLAATFPATVASTTNITSATGITVSTNNDKTGYSLTQAFPTNFASMAITVGGAVTAGTVSDKTGYSLTQTFPTNFASMAITAGGIVDADVETITGDADAATRLERVLSGNTNATVGTGSTTTSIATSSMSPAASATDQFKGKIISFDATTTTAALRGQSTDITASTAAGVLTVTALTTAPVSGDTFTIS